MSTSATHEVGRQDAHEVILATDAPLHSHDAIVVAALKVSNDVAAHEVGLYKAFKGSIRLLIKANYNQARSARHL